jgi:predicted phosphodiesterase
MSTLRWIAVGDNHGVLIHKPTAKRFFEFVKDYKPQIRIHLGDNWDFANLRRGADPREEGDDMEPDLTAGYLFLDKFMPTVFIEGNHDFRPRRLINDARGLVRKFAKDGVDYMMSYLGSIQCHFVGPYDINNVFQLGNVTFLHGFTANINAPAEHAAVYGDCVMGHLHRNEQKRARRIGGATGTCVGGLGDFSTMTYASQRLATHMWGRGWAYGTHNTKTGKTTVQTYIA